MPNPIHIYCVTSPSGKQYVGQTRRTLRKRWQGHCTAARLRRRDTPIVNAILKYGADAFRIELIAWAYDQKTADILERAHIDAMCALVPGGYNLSNGGARGWRWPEAVRAKFRAVWARDPKKRELLAAIGRNNRGRKASAESRARMSESRRGRTASEATREKMRKSWTPERKAAAAARMRARYQKCEAGCV